MLGNANERREFSMCRYRYIYRLGDKRNPTPKYKKDYISVDGTRVMLTRYTHEIALSKHWSNGSTVEGPRGGNACREFARYVWYANGMFYRIVRTNVARGEFKNELVPLSGYIWDYHETQTASQGIPVAQLELRDGRPVHVTIDGEGYEMDEFMWPMCEEMLYLDGRKLPRSKRTEYVMA